MDAGRRCALPGCYVVIAPPADGGPQRKYCTPAHRAVARQLRREATNRSASAPPLILQELPEPPLASAVEAGPVRRRRPFADVAGRRARAMAVLGSAGLLVTGGTLAFSGSPTSDSTTAAPWLAPDPEAEQSWASEVNVTLASLDRQIAEVDQVEREWNELPPQARGDQAPPDVAALARRKALLQQQRARLAQELGTYEALRATQQELSETERHVAGLDEALAEAQRERHRAPTEDDAATAGQLRERRSAGDALRQEQRRKLDDLTARVREAMATPLPSGDHATRTITSKVRDLIERPSTRHDDPARDGSAKAEDSGDGRASGAGDVLGHPGPGGGDALGHAGPSGGDVPGHPGPGGGDALGHPGPGGGDVLGSRVDPRPGGALAHGGVPGSGAAPEPGTPAGPTGPLGHGGRGGAAAGSGLLPDAAHSPGAGPPAHGPHRPAIAASPADPELRQSITRPREGIGDHAPTGPLEHLTGGRPGGPAATSSGPANRVVPGQSQSGLRSGPRHQQGAADDGPPVLDRPAPGADGPGASSTLPSLTPSHPRGDARSPTGRAARGSGLHRSAAGSTGHRSAADDVIDALPFSAGVKQMARSAVADEIRSRRRKGQLPHGRSSSSSTTVHRTGPKSASGDTRSRVLDGIVGHAGDTGGGSTARRRDGGKPGSSFSLDDLTSLSRGHARRYSSSKSSPKSSSNSSSSKSSLSDWLDDYGSSRSGKSSRSGSSGGGGKSSAGHAFERALSRYSSRGSGKKSYSGSSDRYRSGGKSSGRSSGKGGGHFRSKMAKSFTF